MKILKQSTQVDVLIGPLVDDSDFKSIEESVAYNAAGIDVDVIKGVTKADVVLANAAGDGYWRHVANGYYALTLSTTDTGTLGRLRATFEATGVLPAWEDFVVVPANVYDAIVAGSDYLQTDAVEISSSSTAADGVESNIAYLDVSIAGLNDLSAEDVWTYATRTLTSFGTLVADIWEYSTRTITGFGTLIADLWGYATRTLTSFGTLAADVDTQLSGTHGAGSWEGAAAAPTVEQIDARLSNTHGSGSWQGEGAGEIWGDIEVRYKLTEPPEGSGTPIADALVWVTTDEAGTNIVQSRRTNDFGYVQTPFYLDAGRYYFWRSKAGMNFVNPDVEDVS